MCLVIESNVLRDVTPEAGSFNYANPRAIHWGAGSLAQLAPELSRLQVTRVALITTRSLVAHEKLLADVGDRGCDHAHDPDRGRRHRQLWRWQRHRRSQDDRGQAR
jgi:hypothetical protein